VPLGAIGMGLASVAIYVFSRNYVADPAAVSILPFLAHVQGIAISASLFLLALTGGIFTVPLYSLMQARSEESHRARIIAANNVVNSLCMVVSSLFTMVMFKFNLTVTDIFLSLAILSILVAIYTCCVLAQVVAKGIFGAILRLCYGVTVKGLENLVPIENKGAVFIVNHTSLIDGVLLAACLPGHPTFAVNTVIAEAWWVKLCLKLVDHYLIDPTKPMALKSLVEVVASGKHVVIFPEGRITMTGALMKVYEGSGVIANNTKAPIVPIRINGAQFTPFSYMRGKIHTTRFPHIDITILPPVNLKIDPTLTSRQRRKAIGDQLYSIMSESMFQTCNIDRTLYEALLDAQEMHGGETKILEDITRKPMSYDRLVLSSRILGDKLAALTGEGEIVGIFLPNSTAIASTFFSLMKNGRIPAMINFTSGLANIRSACKAASIKRIITSRKFIDLGRLLPVIEGLAGETQIIYLEDIAGQIKWTDKLTALATKSFARSTYMKRNIKPDDIAVVLFTSGSEGTPKGVALSHKNILANRYQLGARIDFNASDLVFNALPVFHSFGLTVGLLLPILSGVKAFLYPSPLHYRIISELVYDTNATIFFGTDTFLNGYARMAHVYDFYSVRYVFAGAEKVKEETRRVWNEKFGLRIFEGYGATETAPTLAINTPIHAKAGTVGRMLPGITYKLDPVPGVDEGGRLSVRGPNIMRGYFKDDQPGVLLPPEDEWYDTGDIVEIDEQGFIKIVGRVKRFAKVAGEMVSLNAVEAYIQALYPEKPIAVVAAPDEKKVTRDALIQAARAQHLGELMIPRQVIKLERIPVLGTGKTDYVTLNQMAETSVS
jgi:acyl-[acyl-carrier-protein]-phospholipid O-acyltransferase / long-chain-fatty-acid--[acyl-carrier-protein] ligase